MRAWLLAILAAVVAGAALLARSRGADAALDARAPAGGLATSAGELLARLGQGAADMARKVFDLPEAAAPYREAIARAEADHGIPESLLGRLLYQESRFRVDIIEGRTVSRAGALGIAQFMPATAAGLGVDPLDPRQAIDGAGRYLRQLFDRFGDWTLAIAAYNWGQGNQGKDLRDGIIGNEWPAETRKYVAEILGDVSV